MRAALTASRRYVNNSGGRVGRYSTVVVLNSQEKNKGLVMRLEFHENGSKGAAEILVMGFGSVDTGA